VVKKDFC